MGIPRNLYEQIKSVYGKKIEQKTDFTIEHANVFLGTYFPRDEVNIAAVLSCDQLTEVVLNYFVDIQRFKERRGMLDAGDQISAGKIAAFTAKWLVKFKPMLVVPLNGHRMSDQTAFIARHINEIFAVSHVERILGKSLPKKLFQELMLEFREKKFSETQLYMTLEHHIGYYADQ